MHKQLGSVSICASLSRTLLSATALGIERPQGGELPIFKDYGRYDYLLSATVEEWKAKGPQGGRDGRTPSLVSFVGQSGAGKSSLIKLLIDLRLTGYEAWPTPVVGGTGVIEPTSEDVHLYADPVTAVTEAHIFFADCEGLSGGEREPISAKVRRQLKKSNGANNNLPQPISERELGWADTNSLRSREFAVTNLYPRLLYTFSDVIVFVLKNPRWVTRISRVWPATDLSQCHRKRVRAARYLGSSSSRDVFQPTCPTTCHYRTQRV